MIDVGFKNFIKADKIIYALQPGSSKSKWLIKEAVRARRIINCTQGKKVGSLIILETDHIVLSALKINSILKRIKSNPLIQQQITDSTIDKNLLSILDKKIS